MAFTISPTQPFLFYQVDTTQADAQWVIEKDDQQPLGSYSLWWENLPHLQGEKVGYIGGFDEINNLDVLPLLEHACQTLKKQGCTMAIAPIDGSTWQRYRIVTETDHSPTFFLESPYLSLESEVLTQGGFELLSQYHSRRVSDLMTQDRRSLDIEMRLTQLGVKIRPLKLEHIERELERLYPVVQQSFQSHFLYTPITKNQFIQQYLKLKDFIVPEFVLIAEHHQQIVGFMFGMLDFANTKLFSRKQTIILKTLGVLPDKKYAGLGILLLDKIKTTAAQMGFNEAIYALIQSGGTCDNMTKTHGDIFRRYGIFGKML